MSVLRRVRESERIWTELETLVEQAKLPARAMGALFDATLGLRVRNSGYRATVKQNGEEISNQIATLDLRAMVKANLLEQRGRNRGSYYVSAPPLVEIRNRIRKGRQPVDTSNLFVPDRPADPQLPFSA